MSGSFCVGGSEIPDSESQAQFIYTVLCFLFEAGHAAHEYDWIVSIVEISFYEEEVQSWLVGLAQYDGCKVYL